MMTNSCYSYRVYNMYRVENPVELNLYYRKRLFHKGRLYWTGYDILHKIHEIYTTMEDTAHRIHCVMHHIAHFAYKSVMAILRLNAPIRVAIMVAFTALYGCALIALTH